MFPVHFPGSLEILAEVGLQGLKSDSCGCFRFSAGGLSEGFTDVFFDSCECSVHVCLIKRLRHGGSFAPAADAVI